MPIVEDWRENTFMLSCQYMHFTTVAEVYMDLEVDKEINIRLCFGLLMIKRSFRFYNGGFKIL